MFLVKIVLKKKKIPSVLTANSVNFIIRKIILRVFLSFHYTKTSNCRITPEEERKRDVADFTPIREFTVRRTARTVNVQYMHIDKNIKFPENKFENKLVSCFADKKKATVVSYQSERFSSK